jgi:hypothetical protein
VDWVEGVTLDSIPYRGIVGERHERCAEQGR